MSSGYKGKFKVASHLEEVEICSFNSWSLVHVFIIRDLETMTQAYEKWRVLSDYDRGGKKKKGVGVCV